MFANFVKSLKFYCLNKYRGGDLNDKDLNFYFDDLYIQLEECYYQDREWQFLVTEEIIKKSLDEVILEAENRKKEDLKIWEEEDEN